MAATHCPDAEQITAIMNSGILAPSADNRHRVTFEPLPERLRLWTEQAIGSLERHRQVLTRLSLGAMVENMLLKAAEFGFTATPEWFPDPAQPSLAAELRWDTTAPQRTGLSSAIAERHTNRRFFRGPRLPPPALASLESLVSSVDGVKLLWLDESKLRTKALRLVAVAEAERYRSKTLHRELFSSIRFDAGWKSTTPEGLPPGALEIEPPFRPFFAGLRHWPVMRFLNSVGVRRMLAPRAAYWPCRLSPHLGLIVTTLDVDSGAIAVGRAFERLWLQVASEGLSLQPMAASALFTLPGYAGVCDEIRNTLSAGWADIAPGMSPLMLFRLGHAAAPSLRAGRHPVSHYLCSAQQAASSARSSVPSADD
jgi:hypothetical protein